MAIDNLQETCQTLVKVAEEAGEIILAAKPSSFRTKKNTVDIVTQTDRAVETFICERLAQKFPTFKFLGEESFSDRDTLTDQPTFIVDPIDGTSNFVHGFPAVCISIGLVIEKQPTVGVVYNPFSTELWTGAREHGAFYRNTSGRVDKLPLVSSPLQGLGPACIGIEWGSDREGPNFELNLKVFISLARTRATGGHFVNSLRCTGSAAITICRVAAAQQDAFWECGSWAWDVAAAWCILNEAGGRMVDGHPGAWNPPINNRRYLAVRPATEGQKEFVEDFWNIIGDDRSTYGPPSTMS